MRAESTQWRFAAPSTGPGDRAKLVGVEVRNGIAEVAPYKWRGPRNAAQLRTRAQIEAGLAQQPDK